MMMCDICWKGSENMEIIIDILLQQVKNYLGVQVSKNTGTYVLKDVISPYERKWLSIKSSDYTIYIQE